MILRGKSKRREYKPEDTVKEGYRFHGIEWI